MAKRIQFTLEELKRKVKEFFIYCDDNDYPYTISELSAYLGVDRSTLLRWEKEEISFYGMNDEEIREYCNTIRKAKMKCEAYAERQLYSGKNPAGVIFSLKNNYGWIDKQEISSTNNNINVNNNLLQNMSKTELLQLVDQLNNKTGKE